MVHDNWRIVEYWLPFNEIAWKEIDCECSLRNMAFFDKEQVLHYIDKKT